MDFGYTHAIVLGVGLALIPCIVYFGTWIWQYIWAWIDDGEAGYSNIFVKWLAYKAGYKDRHRSIYNYTTPDGEPSDGGWLFWRVVLGLFCLPAVIVASFHFYSVTLILILAIGLTFIARFARRLSKKFKLHTSDKDAHKGSE